MRVADTLATHLAAAASAVNHNAVTNTILQPGPEAHLTEDAGVILTEGGAGGTNLFAANLAQSQGPLPSTFAPMLAGAGSLLALIQPGPQLAFQAQGLFSLAELPGLLPVLMEADVLAGVFEDVVEWASTDEVRDWLPWLCGAAMAAVAVEISRRQLKRATGKEEDPPYPEFNASGWLPEPAGQFVPESDREF